MNNVVSVQRLLCVALVGLVALISGCSNDGSATSGSGHVFLPEDNQLPNDMAPPTPAPGGTPPSQDTTVTATAQLEVVVAGIVVANEFFTVTGTRSGTTLRISSRRINGSAIVSGNRFSTSNARFTLNSTRIDCDGFVTLTGTVSGTAMSGRITGSPSCSIDSAPAVSSSVTGSIGG